MVYRLSSFHPLAKFPGPHLCKLSKFWTAWIAFRGDLHRYHKEVHRRYGPIVRVGPNELSVVEADLIPSILGTNGMPKGPVWNGRQITPSKERKSSDLNSNNLIGIRDLKRHAQLRKPWNRAFGPIPLKDYEDALLSRGVQLVRQLEDVCKVAPAGSGHVEMAQYFTYFSFDFMGDMAFGGGFELLRDGDKDKLRENMENALQLPAVSQHIPWFASTLRSMPFFTASVRSFGNFAVQQALRRSSQSPDRRDLFYHLAVQTDGESDKPPFPLVVSNSVLTIIAGSDTTASVLCNITYYLLCHPEYLARLQEEVDKAFPEDTPINLDHLASLELLNTIINETLRLQPPVPTSIQRAPSLGSGGKALGDLFIPEGTAVDIPLYTLHRDPRYFFPDPERFWPERWISQDPKVILNRSAFIPFSFGPANCVGKPLALMELRFLTASLVHKFNMSFEDNYNPDQWERDLKDRFVLAKGKLPIKISLRGD